MRLSDFILANLEPILQEWEDFARSMNIPGTALDVEALRDSAQRILCVIVQDLRTEQSPQQQRDKSQGRGPAQAGTSPAQNHALRRFDVGFTLDQMVSEYRALRASVLRLWLLYPVVDYKLHSTDMIRFNEAVDQALTESIASFSSSLENMRNTLLGVLGHDLRTPMCAILMGAEMLMRPQDLNERQERICTQIHASVNHANQIVENLLDLTRCNLGAGIKVVKEPTDLNPLCTLVVKELRASHPTARIDFESSAAVIGLFDPVRMGQVFSNLIGNALQHGDNQQPIKVVLFALESEVVFSVHNHGEPIPEDKIHLIFNPLESYSGHSERDHGPAAGLGLGLFIAAEIVASHSGKIEVESSLQCGTTFRVTLPIDAGVAAD
ncbi:signal transduction histidine kinase [Pseudomonas sp. BS3782 TE3695]|uniref:sensor histidine kinase n=1 Tax=Pseudomonas sp. BS3782 TE3695 TaxID=3349323 RepID=UPI003D1962D4